MEMHDVGLLIPNDWDLFDMLGGVWEWAWDGFDTEEQIPFTDDPVEDPLGPGGTLARAYRGGALYSTSANCRAAYRRIAVATYLDHDNGLRVVRTAPAP